MKKTLLFLILMKSFSSSAQTADFSFTSFLGKPYCDSVFIQFIDLSVGANSWDWQFTGPSVISGSTNKNPIIQFLDCGIYDVTLKINGGVSSKTLPVVVRCNPTTCFTADVTSSSSSSPPLVVHFSNCSTTNPSGGNLIYKWDFCNGDTSMTKNPFHIYSVSGCYCVILLVTDENGCSSILYKPNYISIGSPGCSNSVNNIFENEKDIFSISPNPANDFINISNPSSTSISYIEIFDLLGRKIISQSAIPKSSSNYSVDISGFPKGYYFVRIHSSEGIVNRKFVLQ